MHPCVTNHFSASSHTCCGTKATMSTISEPFGPRARIIHNEKNRSSANGILRVLIHLQGPAPTFTCFVNTTQSTIYTWQKITGDRLIPAGVTQQHGQHLGLSLIWNRPIDSQDVATYRCESSNQAGKSRAILNLLMPSMCNKDNVDCTPQLIMRHVRIILHVLIDLYFRQCLHDYIG
jgi:hypothetical protein